MLIKVYKQGLLSKWITKKNILQSLYSGGINL
jgi:hypothetical protein